MSSERDLLNGYFSKDRYKSSKIFLKGTMSVTLQLNSDTFPNIAKLCNRDEFINNLLTTVDPFLIVNATDTFTGLTDVQMRSISNLLSDKDQNSSDKTDLSDIKNSLRTLSDAMKISSKKGAFAESLLETLINQHFFDEATVENTSHRDREADMTVRFDNGLTILVESKFYNHAVGQAEVAKFLRDVNRMGVSYAIFVSVASPIVNKKRLHYDLHGSCHILYVSSSETDSGGLSYAVILSIILMKHIFNTAQTSAVGKAFIDRKVETIMQSGKDFEESFCDMAKLRFEIGKLKTDVSASIDKVYRSALEIEQRMKTLLKNLNDIVREQLQDITDIAKPADDGVIGEFLETMNAADDPLYASFLDLFDMLRAVDVEIKICSNGKILLIYDEDVVVEIKRTKKRIDVVFTNLCCTVEFNQQSRDWTQTLLQEQCKSR